MFDLMRCAYQLASIFKLRTLRWEAYLASIGKDMCEANLARNPEVRIPRGRYRRE